MNNKKRIIIIAVLIILLLGAIVIYFYFKQQAATGSNSGSSGTNTPPAKITTDKDTGEQLVQDPNLGKSESQDAQAVILLGLPKLLDSGITDGQLQFIKSRLLTYSQQNLHNKYQTLTLQPENFTQSGGVLSTTIRLGDTNTTVNLTITTTSSGSIQLSVTDPSGQNGGNYTSDTVIIRND